MYNYPNAKQHSETLIRAYLRVLSVTLNRKRKEAVAIQAPPGWLCCNLYSLILLAFILVNAHKSIDARDPQQKAFIQIQVATIVLLFIDSLTHVQAKSGLLLPLVDAADCLAFALSPVILILWMRYLIYEILPEERQKMNPCMLAILLLAAVNAVLAVLSVKNGWYCYVDVGHISHRGPYYFVPYGLIFVMFLISELFIFLNRTHIERGHMFSLNFFLIPPLLCGVVQLLIPDTSLVLSGLTVSELVVFVHIQNGNMYIDYLTGAYNRRRLDSQIRDKIRASTESHTFAAILIDLDNFKSINDTMGHNVGDSALEDTVALLRECIRTNDLLARYGGDEFCIVLDSATSEELEAITDRINDRLDAFNRYGNRPYHLSFSMGCRVYDVHSRKTAAEFQREIDELMYEHKRQAHAASAVEVTRVQK